jgi:type I restriction enzyme S subunit
MKAAHDELARVPLLVKHYQQAILERAFTGELIADWRGSRSPHTTTDLGSLLSDIRYGTSQKCFVEPIGVAVLRIPNVSAGRIDLAKLKYAESPEREIAKLALRDGDILVVRSNGSADLVGRPALVTTAEQGLAYAGYLIRLRPNSDFVLPEFLKLMLEAPQTRRVVETNARSTSGVHNINGEELAALQIPCPDLKEQAETVRRVKAAFDWLNTMAAEHAKAFELIGHLDKALLGKAYRGELVPQAPNDEPADALLERIRGQETAQPKSRGRRKL